MSSACFSCAHGKGTSAFVCKMLSRALTVSFWFLLMERARLVLACGVSALITVMWNVAVFHSEESIVSLLSPYLMTLIPKEAEGLAQN